MRGRTMGSVAVAAVIVLLGLLVWTMGPIEQVSAQNTACFRAQGGSTWACTTGGRMEFRTGSQLEVQAGAVLELQPADVLTVLDAAVVAPTSNYIPLGSAGTVTVTVSAGAAGQVLMLVNTTNTTINLADTGTAKLASAGALGQYDSITLLSDGTNWIEVSRSNN